MYAIYAALIVANIAFFLIEYKGINLITRALKVPTYYMLPIVFCHCVGENAGGGTADAGQDTNSNSNQGRTDHIAKLLHSLIGGLLGLFLSFVGMDAFSDVTRFTFGSRQLLSGFSMTSLLIGFFAIAEIFKYALQKQSDQGTVLAAKIKGFGVSWREFREQFGNMIRSVRERRRGIGVRPA